MRIIAGSAKKRLLKVPPGWKGRPTSDRVKESLFNILGSRIIDSIFLDLFAGTGNVGIEALSRGALKTVFVEKDPRAARTIVQNLQMTGLYGNSRVIARDVYAALTELGSREEIEEKFDIIFLDPPYGMGFEVPVIGRVLELGLLSPGGLIIAESSKRVELPSGIMGFPLVRKERYGDTVISFYRQTE
ncbi:MAG: 16S rRNA (guanine(966)-N(2))-methyltransferase RsmD [Peptococcaceae bacterium]|nr:16S rRNA (guanine(966)-N(2))-methyltransferase RsmD [Peptococcaceae bacterium]